MRTPLLSFRPAAGAVALFTALGAHALGACPSFPIYGAEWRGVTPPPVGSGSFVVAAGALPDGRLLALTGQRVHVESAPGSGVFHLGAELGVPSDPAFIACSPDGALIAAGTGPVLVIFASNALAAPGDPPTHLPSTNAKYFQTPHFDGAWVDNERIALTGQSEVYEVVVTSDPNAPAVRTLVQNIQGASGGVGFDAAGRLFTGNGFASGSGGSKTGWIKAFEPADYEVAPVDFESDGVFIGKVLSAGSLRFDDEGNLFVGGGDFFGDGDFGYVGVVGAAAIASALSGGGPIDTEDASDLRRLHPFDDPFAFISVVFNAATREMVATYVEFFMNTPHWSVSRGGPARLPGDTNGDNVVDFDDVAIVLAQYGMSGAPGALQGDLNNDGVVDFADFSLVLSAYGDEC